MTKKIVAAVKETSLEREMQKLNSEFQEVFGGLRRDDTYVNDYWITESFDDHVIACGNDTYYRANYTRDGDEVIFESRDNWVEVERVWMPVNATVSEKMIEITKKPKRIVGFKGGAGSGHHGHAGRPGKRGGSPPAKFLIVEED